MIGGNFDHRTLQWHFRRQYDFGDVDVGDDNLFNQIKRVGNDPPAKVDGNRFRITNSHPCTNDNRQQQRATAQRQNEWVVDTIHPRPDHPSGGEVQN